MSYWRRLLGRPLAVLALLWLLFLLLLSVSAESWLRLDPLDQDLLAMKHMPSSEY